MTAARTLRDLPRGVAPAAAAGLMLYLDVASCEMDTPESEAIFATSKDLVASLTKEQSTRLRLIVHALGFNRWRH